MKDGVVSVTYFSFLVGIHQMVFPYRFARWKTLNIISQVIREKSADDKQTECAWCSERDSRDVYVYELATISEPAARVSFEEFRNS